MLKRRADWLGCGRRKRGSGWYQAFEHYKRYGMGEEIHRCTSAAASTSTYRKSGVLPPLELAAGIFVMVSLSTQGESRRQTGLVFTSTVGWLGCYASLMSNPTAAESRLREVDCRLP
jgi:hypothetical protein